MGLRIGTGLHQHRCNFSNFVCAIEHHESDARVDKVSPIQVGIISVDHAKLPSAATG